MANACHRSCWRSTCDCRPPRWPSKESLSTRRQSCVLRLDFACVASPGQSNFAEQKEELQCRIMDSVLKSMSIADAGSLQTALRTLCKDICPELGCKRSLQPHPSAESDFDDAALDFLLDPSNNQVEEKARYPLPIARDLRRLAALVFYRDFELQLVDEALELRARTDCPRLMRTMFAKPLFGDLANAAEVWKKNEAYFRSFCKEFAQQLPGFRAACSAAATAGTDAGHIGDLLGWFADMFEGGSFAKVAEVDASLGRLANIAPEHQSGERTSLQAVCSEIEMFVQHTCRNVLILMNDAFEYSTIKGNDLADQKAAAAKVRYTSSAIASDKRAVWGDRRVNA